MSLFDIVVPSRIVALDHVGGHNSTLAGNVEFLRWVFVLKLLEILEQAYGISSRKWQPNRPVVFYLEPWVAGSLVHSCVLANVPATVVAPKAWRIYFFTLSYVFFVFFCFSETTRDYSMLHHLSHRRRPPCLLLQDPDARPRSTSKHHPKWFVEARRVERRASRARDRLQQVPNLKRQLETSS